MSSSIHIDMRKSMESRFDQRWGNGSVFGGIKVLQKSRHRISKRLLLFQPGMYHTLNGHSLAACLDGFHKGRTVLVGQGGWPRIGNGEASDGQGQPQTHDCRQLVAVLHGFALRWRGSPRSMGVEGQQWTRQDQELKNGLFDQ